jgi:hypothetical protein
MAHRRPDRRLGARLMPQRRCPFGRILNSFYPERTVVLAPGDQVLRHPADESLRLSAGAHLDRLLGRRESDGSLPPG